MLLQSYLPSQTPPGIEALRKKELEKLRGDGHSERKFHERVYDYDTYNDLGDPDKNIDHKRPVLGTKEHPYPRRCRTGRPKTLYGTYAHRPLLWLAIILFKILTIAGGCAIDPETEKRSSPVYVPRDEQFSDVKGRTFSATTLRSGLHAILPALAPLLNNSQCFSHFPAIDALYSDGIPLPVDGHGGASFNVINDVIPRVVQMIDHESYGKHI